MLAVTPTSLTFTAAYGPPAYPSAAKTLTLRNTGNIPSTLGGLTFSNPAFSRAGGTCSAALVNNATCTITVVFTPLALGAVPTASLAIAADVAVRNSPVTLNGTGALPVVSATLTPTAWNIYQAANCPGTGNLGFIACFFDPIQAFTLTNTGNVPLSGITQGALSGTNTADFSVARLISTCGPATVGQVVATTTLAPGATCVTYVQFKPLTVEALGTKTAALSITDLAGTQTSALNGTDIRATVTFTGPTPALTTTTADATMKNGVVTVSNAAAATGPLTLTAVPTITKVGAAGGTFSIQPGGTCVSGVTITASGSCTINVRYAPTSTATATANVTITGMGLGNATTQTSGNFTAN